MFALECFVRDVEVLCRRLLALGVSAERFHKIREAINLDCCKSFVPDAGIVPDRRVEDFIPVEVRGVFGEIFVQPVRGHDDRIFLETPARSLLLSRQELQARRFDRGEALFRARNGRRGDDRLRLPVTACERAADDQRESESTVTRTPAPVAPLASRGVSESAYAVPAISM